MIGSTFPVNVSYPNDSDLKIVDLGMTERVYDPIRITQDETVNRHNENIMAMDDAIQDYVISVVKDDIKALNELFRILKKGGLLILMEHIYKVLLICQKYHFVLIVHTRPVF